MDRQTLRPPAGVCLTASCRASSSLERKIATSVMELGNLLSAIKGGGQLNQPTNRNIVAAEADEVSWGRG